MRRRFLINRIEWLKEQLATLSALPEKANEVRVLRRWLEQTEKELALVVHE